jgi:hypothetical protein
MNTLRSSSTHCTPASGEHNLRVGPRAAYAGVPVLAADLEVPPRMFDGSSWQAGQFAQDLTATLAESTARRLPRSSVIPTCNSRRRRPRSQS